MMMQTDTNTETLNPATESSPCPTPDANAGVPGYLSIVEAARILGKSPGAVYMILYRNRQRYRTVRAAGNAILIPAETAIKLFEEQQQER